MADDFGPVEEVKGSFVQHQREVSNYSSELEKSRQEYSYDGSTRRLPVTNSRRLSDSFD